jgi:hypothetical protein
MGAKTSPAGISGGELPERLTMKKVYLRHIVKKKYMSVKMKPTKIPARMS